MSRPKLYAAHHEFRLNEDAEKLFQARMKEEEKTASELARYLVTEALLRRI